MLRAMLVLVGLIIISAGTAAAQNCPACAAADACIAIYKQGMEKVRKDMRVGILQTADGFRELQLKNGEQLSRRATEQMKANAALLAELEVDTLKNCLNKIR